MNLYQKWLQKKEIIKQQTEELHEIEADIWLRAESLGELNPKGGRTFHDGEFSITINHIESVKVDQKKALIRPDLFKVKYEYSKSDYKTLTDSQKEFVDDCITISMNKPQFKVVVKGDKNEI